MYIQGVPKKELDVLLTTDSLTNLESISPERKYWNTYRF